MLGFCFDNVENIKISFTKFIAKPYQSMVLPILNEFTLPLSLVIPANTAQSTKTSTTLQDMKSISSVLCERDLMHRSQCYMLTSKTRHHTTKKKRCVCETLMPLRRPSFEKYDLIFDLNLCR